MAQLLSSLANKILIQTDINGFDCSFTELILNHSNSLHLKAEKFWADKNPSFPTVLQMWMFWESLVTDGFSLRHWGLDAWEGMRCSVPRAFMA